MGRRAPRRGLGKKIDVRRYLNRITVGRGSEDLTAAGIVGDLIPLEIVVSMSASGGVKASEVVEAFLGKEIPFRSVRASMWATRNGRRIDPLGHRRLEFLGARERGALIAEILAADRALVERLAAFADEPDPNARAEALP